MGCKWYETEKIRYEIHKAGVKEECKNVDVTCVWSAMLYV